MKKVITLCLFAFAMLIGTQTTFAQDKVKINENASLKAKELRTQLKFDENAMEKVYLAYQTYENKMFSVEKNMTKGTADYDNVSKQAQQLLQTGIKDAIGNDLFNRYLILTDQEEIINESIAPQSQNKSASQVKQTR